MKVAIPQPPFIAVPLDRSAVPRGEALEAALRRVGRRVLFGKGRVLKWVDACSGGPPMR